MRWSRTVADSLSEPARVGAAFEMDAARADIHTPHLHPHPAFVAN